MDIVTFEEKDLSRLADLLARSDPDLQRIVDEFGYPPFWNRANTYESLIHIILEQQVSLASARAALEKLREKVGEVTPENVVKLSDIEFRAAYFSRQKTAYVKALTQEVLDHGLDVAGLRQLANDEIREKLLQLKGVGNWTVDIYLVMVLHRTDLFPVGDIAAVNALRRLKNLPKDTPQEEILNIASAWQPYRSIATMLLWHYYLSQRVQAARK